MIKEKMKKKTVLLHAPSYTLSGYGVHSRQIATILDSYDEFEVFLQATIWGNTPFMLGDFKEKEMLDKMNNNNQHRPEKFDISVQVILPDEFKDDLADFNIGISACVETTTCNPTWIDNINKMDLMIVPSHHTKRVLENSGTVTTPLYVVPEAFPPILENLDLECNLPDIEFETKFNFLHIGQLAAGLEEDDRKGIYTLIRLFCKAFEGNKDVGLVLKTNSCRNTAIDYKITANTLSEVLKKHRKSEYPKVYLLHGPMKENEVCQLYKHDKIKAFVSLTRGEGYGLPLLEAAATGLPIIATNWSGHLDFLNLTTKSFIKVNYELQKIRDGKVDNRIFINGAKWAHVDEEDAMKKMTKLVESYKVPLSWAKDLQPLVVDRFNINSVNKIFKKVLAKHYKVG